MKPKEKQSPQRRSGKGGGKKTKKKERNYRPLRGLFGLLVLIGCVVAVGSYYIRQQVIDAVYNRAFSSSALVLSRPIAISKGTNLERARLYSRLQRLAYQKTSSAPQHPGQYQVNGNTLLIYTREAQLPTGEMIGEQYAQISLGGQNEVESIVNAKFNEPLEHVWLEPEFISQLGDNSSRASIPKQLNEFSPYLIKAVLSIEDERFYYHLGIDPLAILRAGVVNFSSGRVVQGGSTITQQLAKNLFFTRERSFGRKIYEAFAAVMIETAFTKDQILEFYLNEVFLGQEGNVALHGFGEASQSFFGKEVADLTLAEAATLAGIIKGPSRYSPRRSPEEAFARRKTVLDKMLELGEIDKAEYKEAVHENILVQPAKRTSRVAPFFVDYLWRHVGEAFNTPALASGNVRLHTGLDREYQQCAQQALERGLISLEKQYPAVKRKGSPLQAALISLVPSSGEIRAWVGGRDYGINQFDHVSQAKRQPGSAFKPFVYLTALDGSLNRYRVARTTSLLEDQPVSFNVIGTGQWTPQNYDKEYRGEVTVRYALAHSLNVPTINLGMKVGFDSVAHTAEILGLGRGLPAVPSLALGSGEVSPMELARAYGTIANGGILTNVRSINALTVEGQPTPIYTATISETRVASEPAVFVLTNLLQSVIENGTGHTVRRLGYTRPAAGKTGTTNEERDAWFAGFTPSLLAIVWVGYDDNKRLGLTGGVAAAPIWTEYMKCVEPMEPPLDFVPPAGVVYRTVDSQSGLLQTPYCPRDQIVTEVFVEGTEPITPCTIHNPERSLASPSDDANLFKTTPTPKPVEQHQQGPQGWDTFWKNLF